MVPWIPYAFVRFVLFLIAGITLGIYFPHVVSDRIILIIVVILSVFYFLLTFFRQSLFKFIDPGWVALPLLCLSGYFLVQVRTESNDHQHFIHTDEALLFYKVTITSYPEEKEHSWKEVGEITAVKTNEGWQSTRAKVLLYFDKSEFKDPFQYGDELLVNGKPQRIAPPTNPFEFDYKRFLSLRNIYHQHFLKDDDLIFIHHDPPSNIMNLTFKARAWSVNTIKKYITGEREQAIASALVLGVTDHLDDDLLNAYAASGAMHVLAVSGLHIGILYAIILVVFAPLKKFSSSSWMLAVISLVCLWGYAFVTGLSPSVLRAVTMFSFIALAKPFQKSSDIYNTLALSAFCLLLYDPYLIMSVGFQLSYLAVLGIVYLYPRFILLWAPSSYLMTHVWRITCVSMAAQLATFPLGLLYFHQFPVYFLIANLFVIPLSFVILVAGLILIGVSFIAPLAKLVGIILTYVIKLLNAGVILTEKIPASLITNVHLTTFQCWLLMGLIISFILLFHFRKFSLLYVSVCLGIGIALVQWTHFKNNTGNSKLVVYNVRGHSAMDIFHQENVYHFADSSLLNNPDRAAFQISGNRIANAVQSVYSADSISFVRTLRGCRLIQWNDKLLLQITDKHFNFKGNLSVDYLIITSNGVRSIKELDNKINCRTVIVDSSNSLKVAESLIREAAQANLPIHAVSHQGAFIAKL